MTEKIRKGSTHKIVIRWEQDVVRYVPITGVTSAAPVVITATAHELPDGWRCSVSGIKGGGSALNARHAPPKQRDYMKGTLVGDNTIKLNDVNGAGWAAYTSGGILQFNLPVDLTDATAKLHVRESADISAVLLLELTDADGIAIDAEGKTEITFSAEQTAAFEIDQAYFDMELTLTDGTVLAYPKTLIVFEPEITRE
jgi:hypothetical protein